MLFLDGTWNKDDDEHPPTNIVRMREILKIGVDEALAAHPPQSDNAGASRATGSNGPSVSRPAQRATEGASTGRGGSAASRARTLAK